MINKIIVITATLGNRETLNRTVTSVASIGGSDVKHVIIAPKEKVDYISNKYNITCIPEPEDKKGIYAALNYGFKKFVNEYKYMTFINDDDFWLPEFRLLIDTILKGKHDFVYGKTKYYDNLGNEIREQSCSSRFKDFIPLLKSDIVLLTQQATIINSKWYLKLNGFDESYKLVADSKFWSLLSLENIKYKYLNKCCAGYTIQDGQLSSDHMTQRIESKRLISELPQISYFKSFLAKLFFRLYNMNLYIKRPFSKKKNSKPKKNVIFNFFTLLMPWPIKRFILTKFYGYEIDKTSRIGLSYIFPDKLKMGKNATIGHLNVAIHLNYIEMADDCTISQQNWITGFPINGKSFFEEFKDRKPQLIMGKDSAITKKHLIDCTDTVKIGEYTSIGGYGTQILSHSTSLEHNRQSCAPITIGHHCFVGTRSIILPGSVLPNCSVLGAGAVMKKKFDEEFCLYAGIPAKFTKKMDENYKFFHRTYRPK